MSAPHETAARVSEVLSLDVRDIDFTNKRVGMVGTGATAVQAIPEIAQQAKQLTVFQRTANYCVPARNGKVDPEVIKARKADYDGVAKRISQSFFGFDS